MDVCKPCVAPQPFQVIMRASLALLRLLKARGVQVRRPTQIKLTQPLRLRLRLFANRTLFLSIRHRTFALQAISTNVSSGSSMNVARLWITLCKTWKSCECKRKSQAESSLVTAPEDRKPASGIHPAHEQGHTTSFPALRSKLKSENRKEQSWCATISGLVLH